MTDYEKKWEMLAGLFVVNKLQKTEGGKQGDVQIRVIELVEKDKMKPTTTGAAVLMTALISVESQEVCVFER